MHLGCPVSRLQTLPAYASRPAKRRRCCERDPAIGQTSRPSLTSADHATGLFARYTEMEDAGTMVPSLRVVKAPSLGLG